MLLIGFGSKARQGKDTAAEAIHEFYESKNHLFQKHGQTKAIVNVGIFKFATALYQEVNDYLQQIGGPENIGVVALDGVVLPDWVQRDPNAVRSELAPYGKHPKLLQWWGSDYRRAQAHDYWVKKLYASIPSNIDIALISDVRFPNEADSITGRGGYNVNVTRLNQDGTQYYATDRPKDHQSETALDDYNWQFRLTNHEGHMVLLEEQAITLTEYLRAIK